MSAGKEHERASAAAIAHHFSSRLREWWQRGNELGAMNAQERARIGKDLGLTSVELMELATHGPDAAHQLRERMEAIGLARADVERIGPELMRDMERSCTCCEAKGVCGRDLALRPGHHGWEGYCPNAAMLVEAKYVKDQLPQ